MKPDFNPKDLEMFNREIKNFEYYYEFGAGGSTYLASKMENIKEVNSVESSQLWINIIKENLTENELRKITFHFVDLMTENTTYGYPGKDCPKERFELYFNAFKNIEINKKSVILIDGRFRVACLLNLVNKIDENTTILFDDFLNRLKYYSVILKNFEIVERGIRMVKLRLKRRKVFSSILSRYQNILK